jgi:hypothetical protein
MIESSVLTFREGPVMSMVRTLYVTGIHYCPLVGNCIKQTANIIESLFPELVLITEGRPIE